MPGRVDKRRAAAMLEAGLPRAEIAAEFGCTPGYVRELEVDLGLRASRGHGGPPRKFDHDEARRLRADGLTLRAIGVALGVTAAAVHHALAPDLRAAIARRGRAKRRSFAVSAEARPC